MMVIRERGGSDTRRRTISMKKTEIYVNGVRYGQLLSHMGQKLATEYVAAKATMTAAVVQATTELMVTRKTTIPAANRETAR